MLVPHLEHFFNTMKGDPLDPALNIAHILVVSKPNKDPGEVGNYHPISLINNDIKFLSKILANRLA